MQIEEVTQEDQVEKQNMKIVMRLQPQTYARYPSSISQRTLTTNILQLRSPYLGDASRYFTPKFFDDMHGEAELRRLAELHVKEWKDVRTTVSLECGSGLPVFPVTVYSFEAQDEELLKHIHYYDSEVIHATSLRLGMKSVDYSHRRLCDDFINEILNHHTTKFKTTCFDDGGNFLGELFQLMTDVKVSHQLIKDTFHLIVVTYIMGLSFNLETVSELPNFPKSKHTRAARLVSRQIKHLFYDLQKSILDTTTARLIKILTSPESCEDLLAVFIGVIGLCMACEDQQKTYHITAENNVKTKGRKASIALADSGCEGIEWLVTFVIQMFFHHVGDLRKLPFDGPQHHVLVEFIDAVNILVEANYEVLARRKRMAVSDISYQNLWKNTSRLVARFLLPFLCYVDEFDDDSTEQMASIADLRNRKWW